MSTHPEGHTDHISTQFNVELEDVKNNMLEMGGVVEKQITDAMHCLIKLDSGLANDVITQENVIDSMETSIDAECSLILARRQPAASDLRLVLAIIKTIRDLERMGDESAKIASMSIKLSEGEGFTHGLNEFGHLGTKVVKMWSSALNSFARYDSEEALKVVEDDLAVDSEYRTAMRSMVTYMMEDPRLISKVLNLLWALRALERIGDHAKNIAEHVIYVVEGMDVRHQGS